MHDPADTTILTFVPLVIVLVLVCVPLVRIIRRTGHSGWWVLLLFVPLGNVIGLWVLAFARWPAVDRAGGNYFPS